MRPPSPPIYSSPPRHRKSRVCLKIVLPILALSIFIFAYRTYSSIANSGFNYLWDDSDEGLHFVTDEEVHNKSAIAVIPKIIHQTWKNATIPKAWQDPHNNCTRLLPDYEFKLWTDDESREFIAEHYPWFIKTYDSYPYHIQRVDAIRYFILYHMGGIYLDLDVGCRFRLDPLLQFQVALPKTYPIGYSNDVMMATKNHPFMKQVIENLNGSARSFGTKYPTVMGSTGPMYLSIQHGLYPQPRDVRVLPLHLYTNSTEHEKTSFFEHWPGASWHGKDAKVIMFANDHPLVLVFGISSLVFLVFYHIRRRMQRRRSDFDRSRGMESPHRSSRDEKARNDGISDSPSVVIDVGNHISRNVQWVMNRLER